MLVIFIIFLTKLKIITKNIKLNYKLLKGSSNISQSLIEEIIVAKSPVKKVKKNKKEKKVENPIEVNQTSPSEIVETVRKVKKEKFVKPKVNSDASHCEIVSAPKETKAKELIGETSEQQPTATGSKSKKSKKQKEKKAALTKEEGVVVVVESVDSTKEKIVIDLAKAINKTKDPKEKKQKSDKKKNAAAASSEKEKVYLDFGLFFLVLIFFLNLTGL